MAAMSTPEQMWQNHIEKCDKCRNAVRSGERPAQILVNCCPRGENIFVAHLREHETDWPQFLEDLGHQLIKKVKGGTTHAINPQTENQRSRPQTS
jgi:Fe-S-cluster-containing dehydrogenase component